MKTHTPEFKQELTKMGKQIDSIITYGATTLHDELFSVTVLYEGNLLKSIMKQLEVESSVDIPLETVINYQLGVKVDDEYEYLDYGNYVVTESKKQEDKGTYIIKCYDKMIYAMKEYDEIAGTYPMTIKDYLTALGTKIGVTLMNTTFYNQSLTLPTDLYKGLGYTYRDVLDEIAQATGSMIVVNQYDLLEVKYPNITGDTIDENYLKDINVNFGQKYGPINSIVLSRAGESDNVYIQDQASILQNGLCEVKIVDNQIMNFNDRSDYLQGLLSALDGIEYYINDFDSLGILYYEIGDFYDIQIDSTTYKCLMLNDEINVTSGLKEIIYTEMPEESETDYTKADKTDRRLNQTYIIVDKQNQSITQVINKVDAQDNKIVEINNTVDELSQQISHGANVTISGTTELAKVDLTGVNDSEPVSIKIHPNGESINYLHPMVSGLYPSGTLYLRNRNIQFKRTYTEGGTTQTQYIYYELPADLLYISSEVYDEFYLNYDSRTCQKIKRCDYNADGTIYALQTPVTENFTYPSVILGEGDYEVSLPGYTTAHMEITLMAKNIYTSQFATRVEMNSAIIQTADSINMSVNQRFGNYYNKSETETKISAAVGDLSLSVSGTYATKSALNTTQTSLQASINLKLNTADLISEINASADRISLTAGRLVITSGNFRLDASGNMTCTNGNFSGTITTTSGKIGNMNINSNGIYMFGSSNYDGFGLWKSTAHASGDSYIIFHSGGNSSHIGDAQTRIYLNGKISTSQIVFDARDDNNGSLVGTPLRIRARYNTGTQRPQGEIDITTGDFGIIDDTYGSREVPFMISTLNKWVSIGEPNYNFTVLYNGRNLYYVNDRQYGGNIVTATGIDHQIMIGWDGSQLVFIVDNQIVRRW